MTPLNEIYRQFYLEGAGLCPGTEARLVYQVETGSTEPQTAEAEGQALETEETPEKEAEDKTNKIEEHKQDVLKKIQELEQALGKSTLTQEQREKEIQQITEHTEKNFNKLKQEYEAKREDIGAHKDIHDRAETLKQKITGDVEAWQSKIEQDFEKTKSDAHDALTTQLFHNKGLKESVLKLIGSKKPAGRITQADFEAEIAGNTQLQTALDTYLSDPARAQALEKGEFKFNDAEAKALTKSLSAEYGVEAGKSERAEFKILLNVEIKGAKLLDTFGTDFLHLLSMKYKVTEKDGKALIDGEPLDPSTLGDKLSKDTKTQYETLLAAKKPEDRDKALEDFQKLAGKEKQTAENMQKIQDMLTDPDKVEGLKKMGGMELLFTMVKLLPILKQAYEEMDFKTLGDFANDLTKNPRQIEAKITQARSAYESGVKNANSKQLLAMYHEPYGGEAAARMGEETPYRILMRDPVKKALSGQLRVGDITNIEGDMALTRITTSEAGNKVVIEVKNGVEATRYNVSTDKEGKESWGKGEAIAVGGEEAKGETEAKSEKLEELAGVNQDLVGEGNLLKSMEGKTIDDVFTREEITSAEITIGETTRSDKQKIDKGSTVTIKPGKYKGIDTLIIDKIIGPDDADRTGDLKNQRLFVYQGDTIKSTEKTA